MGKGTFSTNRFTTNNVGNPCDFSVVPFYSIDNKRYSVYFDLSSPEKIVAEREYEQLRLLQKKATPLISVRLRVLIAIKEAGEQGISKRELADKAGVNHNSVQTWRTMYSNGGIEALCSHRKLGFKPSVYTKVEHLSMEQKLKDPFNGLRGYVELKEWIEKEFKKEVKYNTLLKYCMKQFGSSVKVALKSHIKRDEEAVGNFKKTSAKVVKRSVLKKSSDIKK